MIKSDTTTRANGLIQRCEDLCGLGATAITGNSSLYSMFVGWLNQWHGLGVSYRIMSSNGSDADDPNYSTLPSGTFTGTANRDYNIDSSYSMLKIKAVNVSFDGTNWVTAVPFDSSDYWDIPLNDPLVDQYFPIDRPQYDEIANGFKLYPKFTAAQVTAGAKVYVEFYRAPKTYDTTSGTDSYGVALDFQFHHFPAVGAAWEYCKLYKPERAAALASDLFGYHGRYGASIPGLVTELKEWENAKQPSNTILTIYNRVKR